MPSSPSCARGASSTASPDQVYFTLLDEGTYLASVSSFYRILRANAEVRERRRQATHPAKIKPELVASAAQCVLELGHHQAQGSEARRVLRPLRRPRHLQPLRGRLVRGTERVRGAGQGPHRRRSASSRCSPRPADHPRGPGQLDDLEPGGRTAQLLGRSSARTVDRT